MVKKLSLVLAFTGQTKFIFLDEPLVTLDQQTVPVLTGLISERKTQGVNFIFTSHQSAENDQLNAVGLVMTENTLCYQ